MAITAEYLPTQSARAQSVGLHAGAVAARARRRNLGGAALARARGARRALRAQLPQARRFAEGLADAGYEVLNEVVLNQVLVAFGDVRAQPRRMIAAIQEEGTCWCGGTVWQGHTAMRISVSAGRRRMRMWRRVLRPCCALAARGRQIGIMRRATRTPARRRCPPSRRRAACLIVGCGFGGLFAARALARAPVEVLVVDRNNYHLFQPLLYQVASAALGAGGHRAADPHGAARAEQRVRDARRGRPPSILPHKQRRGSATRICPTTI